MSSFPVVDANKPTAKSRESPGNSGITIRPVSTKGIGRLEKDTSKLMELYMQGYESAMSRMEEIREYMMR